LLDPATAALLDYQGGQRFDRSGGRGRIGVGIFKDGHAKSTAARAGDPVAGGSHSYPGRFEAIAQFGAAEGFAVRLRQRGE